VIGAPARVVIATAHPWGRTPLKPETWERDGFGGEEA
jgi:hypothetical protein